MTSYQDLDFSDMADKYWVERCDDDEVALRGLRDEFLYFRTLRRKLFGDGGRVLPPDPSQQVTGRGSKLTQLLDSQSTLQAWGFNAVVALFPALSTVATDILGVPVASVSAERAFTSTKIIHSKLRNKLGPGTEVSI